MSDGSAKTPAVVVDGVSKAFTMPHERTHTLKERALHPMRRGGSERLEALKDVSFAVQPGEFFGIVGRNGSGKSTLLKCLAGIYRTDQGKIYVDGRMSTFIELGVGFNPDLAALENVVINAVMLGLPAKEARARFDEIIEFAELEEFVDLKVKNYSSGMLVRLAFATAIQADADILLIDEVLAVGDAGFQQKCFDVFTRLKSEGKTILFVTHDMQSVTRFCDRAMLLERGDVVMIDEPETVAERYLRVNFDRGATRDSGERGAHRMDGPTEIVEVWTVDSHDSRRATFSFDEVSVLKMRVRFHEDIEDPHFNVVWTNERGDHVFAISTTGHTEGTGRFSAGEEVLVGVSFLTGFAPGRYSVTTNIAAGSTGTNIVERWEGMTSILVTNPAAGGGLADFPYTFEILRLPAAVEPEPAA